jgi:manganese/iron transport system permease protein
MLGLALEPCRESISFSLSPVVEALALPNPVELLELRSTRVALVELGLLAIAGGVVGSFVVLARLSFFAHASGTATFPASVLGAAAGFSPRAAALAGALGWTAAADRTGRAGRDLGDGPTGLLLVAALALGVVLASDVFESGAEVDRLLFGTALAVDGADLLAAGAGALLALAAAALVLPTFAALAFDPEGAPALGLPVARVRLVLLALVAVTVVASLPAVGALLVTSLFVVPAAIARPLASTARSLAGAAVGVAAAQVALGLYVSLWLDVPPGPAVAVVGSAAYGISAMALWVRR